ncbi:hypothetical protein B0H16DRAFT_1762764 [Mycena metata]|uniref:Novel STAND NTPase 1 domain-containing protein n=1 Tax=Mycena metata TaxID=1033252 RepID=A0AAD7I7X4_9AGAR|nr:hypothetical protein B0H16DRAFT_1762764 [Mycena metata]
MYSSSGAIRRTQKQMPIRQSVQHGSSFHCRIGNITACLTPALTLLGNLNDAFKPSFIKPILMTTQALLAGVQLVEGTYQVIYAIIQLHLRSGTVASLSPEILEHISKFTGEVNALLKDCRAGLEQAKEVFKVQIIVTALDQVQSEAEIMHRELLDIISTLSDGTVSDRCFTKGPMVPRTGKVAFRSKGPMYSSSQSTNSLSMLPSKPKIFHGREKELKEIIEILVKDTPRIAILGGGGMGKTSLARAALHHPDTCAKFENRFFISAEVTTTALELAALIGLHLGLEPGPNLIKPVVQYFKGQICSCLLVLENLETPWESLQTRSGVEEFLSFLADIENLALMITMRGSERPGKVRWTRPFLPPLQPLSDEAAQAVFEEITDDSLASDERT